MNDSERSLNPRRSIPQEVPQSGGGASLSGVDRHLGPPETEEEIYVEGHPWPRPEKRIVDGTAEPLDSRPIDENFCPLCMMLTLTWERCHVVGRGVGGDDVQDNLFWACVPCHMRLHRGQQDSDTHRRLVRYCREFVPELGAYADAKKYKGYIERRYLGV
jgi:hypothetical protein